MEVFIGPAIIGVGIILLVIALFMKSERQRHIDKMNKMKDH